MFQKSLESKLKTSELPRHVAIIMDGNGRWAKKRFMPRFHGHRSAVKTVRMVVETSAELYLEALTLYAFSTENWTRPEKEVSVLMELFAEYLQKELDTMTKNNVRLQVLGDPEQLPKFVHKPMQHALKHTENNTGLVLNLAVNYGSRAEILHAIQEIAKQVQQGDISPEEIDEATFSDQLYTRQLPDPDLIIRTSGEQRISNFLLWQAAYSEFYFTETLWPDFTKEHFYAALLEFQKRQRRMGGV